MPVEYTVIIAAITIISSFIGTNLNLRTFQRTQRQDAQQDGAASVGIITYVMEGYLHQGIVPNICFKKK